jgi:hypothetical protein
MVNADNGVDAENGPSPDNSAAVFYSQGAYFDGTDYFNVNNFILNHTFTIEFWVRPDVGASGFIYQAIGSVSVKIDVGAIVVDYGATVLSTQDILTTSWTHVAVIGDWDGSETSVAVFVNGLPALLTPSDTAIPSPVVDSVDN